MTGVVEVPLTNGIAIASGLENIPMRPSKHQVGNDPRGLMDPRSAKTHCVFRSGHDWYGIPALCVDEVTVAPRPVRVAQSHKLLVGLVQLRSNLLPVISLEAMLDPNAAITSDPPPQLIVIRGAAPWALAMTKAIGLRDLEPVATPSPSVDAGDQSSVAGTSQVDGHVVRMLDPDKLLRVARRLLESHWHPLPPLAGPPQRKQAS